MNSTDPRENNRDLKFYQWLLAIAASVYLIWWGAVEWALPGSYNPLASRLAVVAFLFVAFGLSFFNQWVRSHIDKLFLAGVWLITLHFHYLFYENNGDINWIVGSFITVMAINFCFFSNAALLSYSIFVAVLSVALTVALPTLSHSVFLPGLITILIQANIGLRSRHRLITTLAESQRRFELLFNSMFEGVLVHQDGIITDVNVALAQLLQYRPSELIGQPVAILIQTSAREFVETQMKNPNGPLYETRAVKKDRSVIDVEVQAKNFLFENKSTRIVAIKDISDRLRAEEERVATLTMQENVRVRDEFISIASHELKTPISSLKLQTQLIERDLRKRPDEAYPSEKIRELSDVFTRQIDRLTELVETMLDVSRISTNRLVMELEETDLVKLARESVALTGKPVEINAPDLLKANVDRSRLRQVIENLLGNAIKYGEGKPVRLSLAHQQNLIVITVEDHGIGIAPEYLERIFDRFERAISPKNISGLGLGLYIARQIVEAHGGRIKVKSLIGAGSTFTVELPAAGPARV